MAAATSWRPEKFTSNGNHNGHFSRRYEHGATLLTSNPPFDEGTSVLGSERLTGALLDSLTDHVHILEMNGDSYRLAASKQQRRKRNTLDQINAERVPVE